MPLSYVYVKCNDDKSDDIYTSGTTLCAELRRLADLNNTNIIYVVYHAIRPVKLERPEFHPGQMPGRRAV
jgi:hypothetical protein